MTAFIEFRHDNNMSLVTNSSPFPFADVLPLELDADTIAVIDRLTTGRPLDLATYARIRHRADQIRDEVFRNHGVLDVGVPAIREIRENE